MENDLLAKLVDAFNGFDPKLHAPPKIQPCVHRFGHTFVGRDSSPRIARALAIGAYARWRHARWAARKAGATE